ncbi:hypothetical protein ACI6Q2_14400 [Chitinophagaceae bacterium LWZ2-11]
MMKERMQQVKSFILFDFPLDKNYLSTQFATTQAFCQKEIPEWSTVATRQKLIARYWFTHVPLHFIGLLCTSILLTSLLHSGCEHDYFMIFLPVGLISFFILYAFQYRPSFSLYFLPVLETVKATYDQTQTAQLEKCRQAQLSNFSLTLFFYVLTTTNNMNPVACDDRSAALLTRLYGVDSGSLKKNLELILCTVKRKNMTGRKLTELRNRFGEAYTFLEELNFSDGIQKLQVLETKFFTR